MWRIVHKDKWTIIIKQVVKWQKKRKKRQKNCKKIIKKKLGFRQNNCRLYKINELERKKKNLENSLI
jgi:hypothetical protein